MEYSKSGCQSFPGILKGSMIKLLLVFMSVFSFSWFFLNDASGQESPDELIRIIENPRYADKQNVDSLTIAELMSRNGVPGVSIAVIQD